MKILLKKIKGKIKIFICSVIKKIKQKIFQFTNLYRYLKIQTRLLLTFVFISLMPILIVSYTAYSISISTIDKKISIYSNEIITQIEKNFSKELIMIESTAKELTFNEEIVSGIENYNNMDIAGKREFIKKFNSFLILKREINNSIDGITAYIDEETQFGDNIQMKIPDETIADVYKQAEEKNRQSIWSIIKDNQSEPLIVIGRTFKSNYTMENLGLLVIFVKNKYLYNSIKDVNIGEGANILIVNSDGITLADKSSQNAFGKEYKNKELIENIMLNEKKDNYVFPTSLKEKPQLISFSKVSNTNWYIVVTIPYEYLNKETKMFGNIILIVVITFSALALLLSYFIAYSISKPLKNLTSIIQKAADGDLTIKFEDNTKDEIAIVLSNFNNMLKNISEIILGVSEMTKNVRLGSENISYTIKENSKSLINILHTNTRIANGAVSQADDLSESILQLSYLSEQINKTEKNIIYLTEKVNKAMVAINTARDNNKIIKNKTKIVDKNDNLFKTIYNYMENISNSMEKIEELVNKVMESKAVVLKTINRVSFIAEESAIISDSVLKTTTTQVVESERLVSLSNDMMKMSEDLVKSISVLKLSYDEDE